MPHLLTFTYQTQSLHPRPSLFYPNIHLHNAPQRHRYSKRIYIYNNILSFIPITFSLFSSSIICTSQDLNVEPTSTHLDDYEGEDDVRAMDCRVRYACGCVCGCGCVDNAKPVEDGVEVGGGPDAVAVVADR